MMKKTEAIDVNRELAAVTDETLVHMTFATPVHVVLSMEQSTPIIAITGRLVASDGVWYEVYPSKLFTTENKTVTVGGGEDRRLLVRHDHLVAMVTMEKQ